MTNPRDDDFRPAERRQQERIAIELSANVVVLSAGEPAERIPAKIIDISERGLRFSTLVAPIMTYVRVDVELDDGWVTLPDAIVRGMEHEGAQILVRAEFTALADVVSDLRSQLLLAMVERVRERLNRF